MYPSNPQSKIIQQMRSDILLMRCAGVQPVEPQAKAQTDRTECLQVSRPEIPETRELALGLLG